MRLSTMIFWMMAPCASFLISDSADQLNGQKKTVLKDRYGDPLPVDAVGRLGTVVISSWIRRSRRFNGRDGGYAPALLLPES